MAYLHPVVVEFEDVDTYGIAHHARLISYLERARVHYFAREMISLNSSSFSLVMASMDIRFLAPAKMLDRLEVEMGVAKLSQASVVWDYRILHGSRVLVTSQVRQASIDLESMKPRRFPDEVMQCLEVLQRQITD